MAWEKRNGQLYYYHKQRVNGRSVSTYIGNGSEASQYEQKSRQQQEQRRSGLEPLERLQSLNLEIEQVFETLNHVIRGVLLASGYHQHKRQWRRKRNEKRD